MASARTTMTSSVLGRPSAHHTCIKHPQRFVSHPDNRYPVSKSLFTYSSKCYSSSFSIIWPLISAPTQSHRSAATYSSRIRALTLGIVAASGTLFGAALSPFSLVHGWPCTRTYRVLRRGRPRIVFKGRYETLFCHLSNIAFRCSYVHCWYPSIYWLGRSDNT